MSAAEDYTDAELIELQTELVGGIDAAVARTFERLNEIPDINELYAASGIEPPAPLVSHPLLPARLSDVPLVGRAQFAAGALSARIQNKSHIYQLARAYAGDGEALKRMAGPTLPMMWQEIQSEIGVPGTRIVDGRLQIEPNGNLTPSLARGNNSFPGEYEELYRVDPTTYRHTNETASLICGATYDPVIPQELAGLAEVVERANRMIQGALDRKWKSDASTFIHRGFAPSELIWETKEDGFIGLHAAKFREQSSVEKWHFDERGSELIGCEFQGLSDGKFVRYILPRGLTPDTARLLLVNIAATGNNVEGVPPTRPIVGLDKLRRLIVQTFGISYQRYGVPIIKVFWEFTQDLSKLLPSIGGTPSNADLQSTVNRINGSRARAPGAIPLKPGISLDVLSPTNDMPDPLGMLEYIDRLKSLAFANEGALLGQQNFGSYAMADVSDQKFLRSAPFYAGQFASAYDQLLRLHILFNFEQAADLELWPHYEFRFAGTQDSSRWLDDATKLMAAGPQAWPDAMRQMAAKMLTLPAEVLDPIEQATDAVSAEAGEAAPQPQGADLQATALNGAQVSSMVEVLAQVGVGGLAPESAIRILMRAFQMSRSEAAAMVDPAAAAVVPETAAVESVVPELDGVEL